MAVTTTAVNACDCIVSMDDAGGNLVDISGNSNNVKLDFSKDIGEFKPFGSKWPIRLDCGKDAKLAIDFVYTTTASEGFQMLKAWFHSGSGLRTFRIDVPDSSNGNDRYEGEFLLENFSVTLDSDTADPITVTASFMPSGEVTISTIS